MMNRKIKFGITISSLLLVFVLLLAACQPAETPTPTEPPMEETVEPEEEEAALIPMIENPRQNLEDGNVIIDKVVMDQGGWVVIHADEGGEPGPIIGYIEVPEGVSTEVYIQVVPDDVTETLYAMLHVDEGTESEFEFPDGDDVPVLVDGEPVTVAFDAVTDIGVDAEQVPSITNPRQNIEDGMVVVDQVIMNQDGWVVIHADEGGEPGPVIGYIEVPEGVSTEVYIQVVPEEVTQTLFAMLHVDEGTQGQFEFPEGDDVPVTVDGEVVVQSFDAIITESEEREVGEVPSIVNPRQSLEGGMVIVDRVYMAQPGWVVIHADEDGEPGPVIGYIEVPEGVSTEVFVQISPDETTETLYAMLHLDEGTEGEFEFPDGPDDPVTVEDEIVMKTFDAVTEIGMEAEQVPSITNPRQSIADGMVVIDRVIMNQDGWIVVHADEDGEPGPVIGYTEVPEGVSTEVFVQISPEDTTEILYAMLHVDEGTEGEFDFPDGDDVPVTVDGEVVQKSFDSVTEFMEED